MTDFALSKQQIHVVSALSEGANMTDAAAQAGVHRNTIANWRRNSPPFAHALSHAQYDRAMLIRENAETLIDLAIDALEAILTDPKASPSVRLKAAMYIVNMATTPPPQKERVPLDIEKIRYTTTDVVTADPAPEPETAPPVHNSAQPETPEPVQTIRRDSPKIGRNETYPCGSGQKFKRCCLNKPRPNPQAQAA